MALAQEVFQGTILSGVAGQALSGVLTIAKDVPFMGPIVSVLNGLKGMVESYQDAEEECRRLVVWCVGSLGCIVKLYSGGGGEADPSKHSLGLLDAAVDALKDLKGRVEKRTEPSKGGWQSVAKFWKSGIFLERCERAKKCVDSALECLMIDVSVETSNGVRELLRRTDLLADMTQSMEQVCFSMAAIKQGVGRVEAGQSELKKRASMMRRSAEECNNGMMKELKEIKAGQLAVKPEVKVNPYTFNGPPWAVHLSRHKWPTLNP